MTKSAHKMASDFLLRFWSKVERGDGGCWLWTGACDESGYGRFALRVDGRTYPAQAKHIAWELIRAEQLPVKAQLNHTCDVAACVNPDHLYIGTQQENMRDRWERTGMYRKQATCDERPITNSRRTFRKSLVITATFLLISLSCGASPLMPPQQFNNSRKPWQFRASVIGWLEWRSGSSWRPTSDRFHPDRFDYVSAINLMNEAWASPSGCSCPYCSGAPFADERKPVASVKSAAKKACRA